MMIETLAILREISLSYRNHIIASFFTVCT